MFLQKSPVQCHTANEGTHLKQALLNFSRQKSKQDKNQKLSNLRQLYISGAYDWHKPLEIFLQDVQKSSNQYSMLVTLFQIAEEPLWRNKVPHLCSLIKLLHNECVQGKGSYLSQIRNIHDYHNKLCRIFYLNDNLLQEHFKLLIMLYLSYNIRQAILDERKIVIGLMHAGRQRSDNRLPEYLWIVSQLKVDSLGISKLMKYGAQIISQTEQQNLQIATQTLIPIITSLSNYICYENDLQLLVQLMDNSIFQQLLIHCLSQQINSDLFKQTLLLCNNILAKSPQLASKILSCQQVVSVMTGEGEEQQIFRMAVQMYRKEGGQFSISQ